MAQWFKFPVNIQNIKHETEKAVLIAMPHNSDYDGFEFWHPKKLVRNGSNSYEVFVSISDTFRVTLKRVSEKTFKVLDERIVGYEELLDAFGKSPSVPVVDLREKVVTHVPEKLNPVKVEANASLVR